MKKKLVMQWLERIHDNVSLYPLIKDIALLSSPKQAYEAFQHID